MLEAGLIQLDKMQEKNTKYYLKKNSKMEVNNGVSIKGKWFYPCSDS